MTRSADGKRPADRRFSVIVAPEVAERIIERCRAGERVAAVAHDLHMTPLEVMSVLNGQDTPAPRPRPDATPAEVAARRAAGELIADIGHALGITPLDVLDLLHAADPSPEPQP